MDHQTQQVLNALTATAGSKCYATCVKYPETRLSDPERQCILRCTDRFLEAVGVTMNAVESYRDTSGLS